MKTSKRFNIKTLAIAVLAATGSAQAAINPGQVGSIYPGGSSSGELFLSVWDQLASTSYSYDLGTTVDALLANPTTPITWTLDSRFQTFASANPTDPLIFNIAGSNGYPGITTGGVVNSNFGFLASHRLGASFNTSPIANASLGQIYSAFTGHIQYLNNAQVAQNPGATQGDFTANLSEVTSSNTGSYFNNQWGVSEKQIPWNASAVVRSAGVEDQVLDLYFIHGNPAATSAAALINQVGGGASPFLFTLNASTATLTWAAAPSTVPLPAAGWLLFSGLGALGVFTRRGRKAA